MFKVFQALEVETSAERDDNSNINTATPPTTKFHGVMNSKGMMYVKSEQHSPWREFPKES